MSTTRSPDPSARARSRRRLCRLGALLAVLACAAAAPAAGAAASARGDDLLRLHLLWTNDLHGHIAPEGARFMNPNFPPPLGGAASAATYIRSVRAEAARRGEEVLLIDVGDMFQGTPVGTKTRGEAVIDYFNHIGYDLAVPGNHDFDLGRENTERLANLSRFPWLCANLVEQATGEVVSWCRPTLMLERGGLKIGVIGIITPGTAHMSFPDNIAGLEFLPMPETVARWRDVLREQGAELILLAIHEGLPRDALAEWRDRRLGTTEDELRSERTYGTYGYGGMSLSQLVAEVPGIHIAVGGHTHQGYNRPWIDPVNHTLCFETYGNGSSLGHAILKIDRRTRALVGYDAPQDRGVIVTLFEDQFPPDPATVEVLRPWLEQTDAEMDQVVGRLAASATRGDAGSNLVGFLVTDAMLDYFDADFAIQNLGGLRQDLTAGDVTARDVFGCLPFGNELVVAKLSGDLLRQVIEGKLAGSGGGLVIGGGIVAYDPGRPDGDRLVRFEIGGAPLDLERVYRVVVSSYLMEGNSGMQLLTTVAPEDVELTQISDAEVLERYLRRRGVVRPQNDGRWSQVRGKPQAPYLARPAGAS